MRKLFQNLFAVPMIMTVLSGVSSAAVYNIQPDEDASKDTFAYQFIPGLGDTFFGIISAGNTGPSSPHSTQAFIQFDLSSLASVNPDDVTSATIRVFSETSPFGASTSATSPVDVSLHNITSSWSETGMAWASKPTYDAASLDVVEINAVGQYFTFDVTDLLKSWLDGGTTNNGLTFVADEEVRVEGSAVAAVFSSASATTAENRPLLSVTAVPEPGSALLLASVAGGLLTVRRRR